MLHAIDRQKIILDNLKVDSVTSINHLIQKTKFHESTIRRDLKILAVNQKIVIVRGGVIPLKEVDKKPNFIKNIEQKKKIARYAASLIKEKDSIIINGGSTCSLIPDYLENNNLEKKAYLTAFHNRLASFMIISILALLALQMSLGSQRKRGSGFRILIGMIIGLAYFIAQNTILESSQIFEIRPEIIGYIPLAFVSLITMILFSTRRTP